MKDILQDTQHGVCFLYIPMSCSCVNAHIIDPGTVRVEALSQICNSFASQVSVNKIFYLSLFCVFNILMISWLVVSTVHQIASNMWQRSLWGLKSKHTLTDKSHYNPSHKQRHKHKHMGGAVMSIHFHHLSSGQKHLPASRHHPAWDLATKTKLLDNLLKSKTDMSDMPPCHNAFISPLSQLIRWGKGNYILWYQSVCNVYLIKKQLVWCFPLVFLGHAENDYYHVLHT